MNSPANSQPENIRSEIGDTRRRMDDKMDEIGERLQPRHLIDEVLGYFRGSKGDGSPRFDELKRKITHGADTAMHTIVDTVKKNPGPALLVGAGIAWMIYESRRSHHPASDYRPRRNEPDAYLDRPLDYPNAQQPQRNPAPETAPKTLEGDGANAPADQVKEKLGAVGDAFREKYETVKEQAGEMTAAAGARGKEMYQKSRDRVAAAVEQHPLEIGLIGLAAGLIVGLMLPTPDVVNRTLGDAADKMRNRVREAGAGALSKGRQIADAAVTAGKEEAGKQGAGDETGEAAAQNADSDAPAEGGGDWEATVAAPSKTPPV